MNGVLIPAGEENPLYIGGLKRVVYLFLMDFLPGGQLMQFYDLSWQDLNRNPVVMLCGSLVFAVGTTVVGMILFRKKNLK